MKYKVTLELEFELTNENNNEKEAVQELLDEMNKAPIIAVGADIRVKKVQPVFDA